MNDSAILPTASFFPKKEKRKNLLAVGHVGSMRGLTDTTAGPHYRLHRIYVVGWSSTAGVGGRASGFDLVLGAD